MTKTKTRSNTKYMKGQEKGSGTSVVLADDLWHTVKKPERTGGLFHRFFLGLLFASSVVLVVLLYTYPGLFRGTKSSLFADYVPPEIEEQVPLSKHTNNETKDVPRFVPISVAICLGLTALLVLGEIFVFFFAKAGGVVDDAIVSYRKVYIMIARLIAAFQVYVYILLILGYFSWIDALLVMVADLVLFFVLSATFVEIDFNVDIQNTDKFLVVDFYPQVHFSAQGFIGDVSKLDEGTLLKNHFSKSGIKSQEQQLESGFKKIDDLGNGNVLHFFIENPIGSNTTSMHERTDDWEYQLKQAIRSKMEGGLSLKKAFTDLLKTDEYQKRLYVWGAAPFLKVYGYFVGKQVEIHNTITNNEYIKMLDKLNEVGLKDFLESEPIRQILQNALSQGLNVYMLTQDALVHQFLITNPNATKILNGYREALAIKHIKEVAKESKQGDEFVLQFGGAHQFSAWNKLREKTGVIINRKLKIRKVVENNMRKIWRYDPKVLITRNPDALKYVEFK